MPFTLNNKTPAITAAPSAIAATDRLWDFLVGTLTEGEAGLALIDPGGPGFTVTGAASVGAELLELAVNSFISASANSVQVEYRALGFFASPLLITAATSGPSDGSMSSGEI